MNVFNTAQKDFLQEFHNYLGCVMDDDGFYPYPGMAMSAEQTTEIASITNPPHLAYEWLHGKVHENCQQCIVGIDRFTKEGQGTEFDSCLSVLYWDGSLLFVGVVNYDAANQIIRDYDWKNFFWGRTVTREIAQLYLNELEFGEVGS